MHSLTKQIKSVGAGGTTYVNINILVKVHGNICSCIPFMNLHKLPENGHV